MIIKWFPWLSFPQKQIQKDRRIVAFLNPPPSPRVVWTFLVHFYCKICLSSLNINDLEGQGLKQIRELVGYFHYVLWRWARFFYSKCCKLRSRHSASFRKSFQFNSWPSWMNKVSFPSSILSFFPPLFVLVSYQFKCKCSRTSVLIIMPLASRRHSYAMRTYAVRVLPRYTHGIILV